MRDAAVQEAPFDRPHADPGAAPGRGTGPLVRTPLAVVVSRFPLVTETFILRELGELERQGQPVVLAPLLRERPAVAHPEAGPWVKRALYTPFLSPSIAAANLRCLWRRPRAYLRTLGTLVRGHAGSLGMLSRTIAIFPKSVYLAERLADAGVGHVHAHFVTHPGTAAWVIQELAGIPYSLTAHAHDIFVRRDMLDRKLAGARFVRCVSQYNRDFLAARHPRHAEKLRVVHVGVPMRADEDPVAPVADVPRLLCVAALKPYKGHAVLLAACRRLREAGIAFSCDIVGDGPLRAELASAIAKLGLAAHVRLLGAQTQEQVAALLAPAAAVVQPSVVAADGQMEGIPVALMEAMAAGKPVVASALSGIPELVRDGVSGLLVPPGDAAALAAALQRVLGDPALATRMGRAGRLAVALEFELGATVGELLRTVDGHREQPPPPWPQRLRAAGLSSPVVGLRRRHERADSSVAEILLPSEGRGTSMPREVVLKVHRSTAGTPSPHAARRETRALARLELQLAGAGEDGVRFGTPRPLRLDEGEGLVLMAACAGEPLAERIRRLRWLSPTSHDAALRDVARSGAWLRAFQERTRDDGAARGLDGVLRAAEADVEAARLPRDLRGRVSARLRSLPPRVDATRLRAVGHHGDLWPGNIFVDDESVFVVDLEGYRHGLPYEDAAYLLVQLQLFYSYPPLAGRRRRVTAAFLDGYLGGSPLDPAAWAFFRTASTLQVLARTRPDASRGTLRAGWRRRALLALLEAEP